MKEEKDQEKQVEEEKKLPNGHSHKPTLLKSSSANEILDEKKEENKEGMHILSHFLYNI